MRFIAACLVAYACGTAPAHAGLLHFVIRHEIKNAIHGHDEHHHHGIPWLVSAHRKEHDEARSVHRAEVNARRPITCAEAAAFGVALCHRKPDECKRLHMQYSLRHPPGSKPESLWWESGCKLWRDDAQWHDAHPWVITILGGSFSLAF